MKQPFGLLLGTSHTVDVFFRLIKSIDSPELFEMNLSSRSDGLTVQRTSLR